MTTAADAVAPMMMLKSGRVLTRSSSETNLLKMNAAGEGQGGILGCLTKISYKIKIKLSH